MNMYRCKTAVDLCLYGKNGIEIEKTVKRSIKSAHASLERGKATKLQRPKWYRPNLPVTNGASKFIRLV